MSRLLFSLRNVSEAPASPPLRVAPNLRACLSEKSYVKHLKAAKRYLAERGIPPWTNWKK